MNETLKKNLKFGAKVVRGAYMMLEEKLAKEKNLQNPIHENFGATSSAYNSVIASLLESAAAKPEQVALFIATHNSESIQLAVQKFQMEFFSFSKLF